MPSPARATATRSRGYPWVSRSLNGSNAIGLLEQVGGVKCEALLVGDQVGARHAEQQPFGAVERDLGIGQPRSGVGKRVYGRGLRGDAMGPCEGADGGGGVADPRCIQSIAGRWSFKSLRG
jgi:hypothetical protein